MNPLSELARLVLPVACPCGVADVRWCDSCAAVLSGPPVRVESAAPRLDRLDGTPPLPVWALVPYVGVVRDVVVHWKDRGRADLDGLLCPALSRGAGDLAPVLAAAAGGPVLVVPVPSTGAALRARGRAPVAALAGAVARGLRQAGADAATAQLLHRPGSARDQVGLGSRARGRNLASAVRLTRQGRRALPGPCLLVDDVLTTGATLAAAERTLEGVGAAVLGAFVLAATPPPDAGISDV
ncbi:ComF family protein [Antribacter gilvus]|uniref:ComF family protein n=1 Tax=Antribacter gilvus TaxID=2304675 RepID=UPI000F78DE87|nr:ComF family protein [Antribacter gilvus]